MLSHRHKAWGGTSWYTVLKCAAQQGQQQQRSAGHRKRLTGRCCACPCTPVIPVLPAPLRRAGLLVWDAAQHFLVQPRLQLLVGRQHSLDIRILLLRKGRKQGGSAARSG